MNIVKNILKIGLPILVLALGVVFAKKIISGKKKPKKIEQKKKIPVVGIETFKPVSENIVIKSVGSVTIEDYVNIVPQVSGKLTYISPNMRKGGFIKKGEILFKIDRSDYILRVETAQAAVEAQKVQLKMEEEEGKIAKMEWEQYKKRAPNAKPGVLTLRKPQLELAKVNLKSAEAQLKLAKLNLRRTVLRAPFDGRVKIKNVSIGQYVAPGSPLATLIDIDSTIVTTPIKYSDSQWIDIPRDEKSISKTNVEIYLKGGDQNLKWDGKLTREETQMDMRSKMLNLIIDVEKPYKNLKNPLIEGAFVDIRFIGDKVENVFKIPRYLLQKGDKIYYVQNGKLHIDTPKIVKYYNGSVYIKNIKNFEKIDIVNTRIDVVVDGMDIKVGKL